MPKNFESGYANGVRARQLARKKAERAKIFADSYLKPRKRKSPFGAIKERMDTVKKHSIKQGIGAAAIKFRRKKKSSYSVSSETDTPENDVTTIPGQPLGPGQESIPVPPTGPPPEQPAKQPVSSNYPLIDRGGHEFPLAR